ncbi:hypothetical protein DH2020_047063 [Rehmannia glutinosa]|uniref:Transcription factor ABORTED MICROSPORES n=1 Tax=Rehmannia glutinosa TaxID=99300 RepID=A0ABR0UA00_REHGL
MLVQSFIERLRPLVGIKCWDYIVLWKLSNDHRCIEWMDCCCAGSENIENGGEELNFEASSSLNCRDIMFPHPRIKSCDLLDQLPSSMLLDSGVHAQTLFSNQASWLNYSHNSDSSLSEETIGTRVLIPVSLGLLELFVTKQVPEDQKVIDFIMAQCNFFLEQQTMSNSGTTDSFSSDPNAQKDPLTLFQQQISKQNLDNLPHDISIDRINLSTSPLNPNLQQFGNTSSETGHANNGIFLEGTTYESSIFTPSIENGFQELETTHSNMRNNSSRATRWMDPTGTIDDQINDDSFMCENNRSDESDPNDDEDDAKASILGDAIDYVNELKQQVEDLQIELEEHSGDEDARKTGKDDTENSVRQVLCIKSGTKRGPKREHENFMNGFHKGSSANNTVTTQELDNTNDKVQQMEPQVEVFQIDGNEFFVKVFSEHKSGGFVRLTEALNSLGLEVTNVNTTRHTCLVSTIFKVERKNDETVQAEEVKESLLELTRNPSRKWPFLSDQNATNIDSDYRVHHHYSRQINSHHLQH